MPGRSPVHGTIAQDVTSRKTTLPNDESPSRVHTETGSQDDVPLGLPALGEDPLPGFEPGIAPSPVDVEGLEPSTFPLPALHYECSERGPLPLRYTPVLPSNVPVALHLRLEVRLRPATTGRLVEHHRAALRSHEHPTAGFRS